MNEILTFEQWVSEFGSDAEADYAHYYEEYGDAMNCMLSEYKQQKYREYIESVEPQ